MNTAILTACWALFVGTVFLVVTRPGRNALSRAPLALGPGIAAIAWVLATGAIAMTDMTAQGAWTGATIAIAFVPMKALLFGFLAYYCGRSIMSARIGPQNAADTLAQRWGTPIALAVIFLYFFAGDVIAVRNFTLERHAQREDLNAAEVEALAVRVREGRATDDEAKAFIANPLCPDDVREGAVTSPDQYIRLAATRNPMLSMDSLLKLAHDPEYQVRLYAIYSRRLPPEELSRLSRDTDENVREALAWRDELPAADFQRLTADSSARVRATAALQARIADADLKRLLVDPDPRVHDGARRTADRRGWE